MDLGYIVNMGKVLWIGNGSLLPRRLTIRKLFELLCVCIMLVLRASLLRPNLY